MRARVTVTFNDRAALEKQTLNFPITFQDSLIFETKKDNAPHQTTQREKSRLMDPASLTMDSHSDTSC